MASRSVLIVSPHFPPINAPDHQRVRMALPYFREFGWEPVVLSVAAEYSESSRDETLTATLPEDTEIHRVRALPAQVTRTVGLGSLALRSLPYLRAKGNEILASRKFDLVFFSTSLFPVMALGPVWHKRFSIPYVLDLQDPWLTDYYDSNDSTPPGGQIKYGFSKILGKLLEPRVVREAAHIIVVSPAYPELLRERYAKLNGKFTVLPFAASETDFETAKVMNLEHGVFRPRDGLIHWVYAGAVGSRMEKSLRAFFLALKSELGHDEQLAARLRIHFVGTDYADRSRARKTVAPLAAEYGLSEIVHETTDRLPFLTTLKLLSDADALLVFGSNDPSYTASKIFPYILARKPLLVIVHEQSSVADIVRQCRAGVVVTFGQEDRVESIAERISKEWGNLPVTNSHTDWPEFARYGARAMTASLAGVFDEAVAVSARPIQSNPTTAPDLPSFADR